MGVAGEKEVIYKPEVPVNKVDFDTGKFSTKASLHQETTDKSKSCVCGPRKCDVEPEPLISTR